MACLCHLVSALTNTDNTLKVAACHLATTLTNTDDKAEDLAVHRQACLYGSDGTLPISYSGFRGSPTVPNSYSGLKAVQPYRALNCY